MSQSKMALKPYLEAIHDHCNQLSKDELKDIIIHLAKEMAVGERTAFFSKLYAISPIKPKVPDKIDEIGMFDIYEIVHISLSSRFQCILLIALCFDEFQLNNLCQRISKSYF